MSNSLEDDNYLNALHKTTLFQEEVGLTRYIASNQADQVIIRQNNTIIELLISLHGKIDNITKKFLAHLSDEIYNCKKSSKLINEKDIDPRIIEEREQELQVSINEIRHLFYQVS